MKNKTKKPSKKLTNSNVVCKEIYRINWDDHTSRNNGWVYLDDQEYTPILCSSVGFKVYEDDKVIALAQSVRSEKRGADTISILKSAIVDKEKLGEIYFG